MSSALSPFPGCFRCSPTRLDLLLSSRQTSEELKGLLETALAKQKEALIAHWGQNVDEEGRIDRYFPNISTSKDARAGQIINRQ